MARSGGAGPGATRRVGAQRLIFALYALGPVTLFFFLPLVFYRIPLVVYLSDREAYVGAYSVAYATAVCVAWFSVAFGILLWPARSGAAAPAREWSPRALWSAFVWLSAGGSAVSVLHAVVVMPPGLEDIVHQLAFAPVIGCVLGMLLLRRLRLGEGRRHRAAVWALLLLDLGAWLGVPVILARVAPAAFGVVALLYGLTAMRASARSVLAVGAALVTVVLIALPVKEVVRAEAYRGRPYQRIPLAVALGLRRAPKAEAPRGGASVGERVRVFDPEASGLRLPRATGALRVVEFGMARVLNRIDRLSDLAYVVQTTPRVVPYAGTATYRPLVGALVPRLLWPGKPREEAGQFYGHRYRFLDPRDTEHSVNLPMVTEGWVSGGWAGVLLSAAFVGLVLRLVWRYWIGASGAPGNVMIWMAVLGTAVDAESNLSLIAAGVVHALVVYWALDVVIRSRGAMACPAGYQA